VNINVELDTADWEGSLDLLVEEYRAAARDASVEAANDIQGRTREDLTRLSHPPHTKTPSRPGMPPAAISGKLAESVVVDQSDPVYVDVGPTARYGREQELGGPMEGHPYMRWREDGKTYYSRRHSLPPRPYLKPATEEIIDEGTLTEIYYRHWADAQAKVTGLT
jgi:hypothetical protein